MFSFAFYGFALLLVWMSHWVYRWKNPKGSGKLPPGSMGWPLIGETLEFFKQQRSFDINPFIKERTQRYGPLFRTSLVGYPVVVSTDPEFSHFLFLQEGQSVEFWYMDTFMKLLGQDLAISTGQLHKYLKNLIWDHYSPDKQKEKLLFQVEDTVRHHLASWATQGTVDLRDAASDMAFSLSSKKLLSYEPSRYKDNLRDRFSSFIAGLISFPLNIPGTVFHKCLQDQKVAVELIRDLLKERMDSRGERRDDFIDSVIEEMKKDDTLFTLETAPYFLFTLLFASFETVSLAVTLAIKFITECPVALKELAEEHDAIIRSREDPNSPVTWKEYKEMMPFTSNVIKETLRIANIAPFMLRRVIKDISINGGYTIPKGWIILICAPSIHFNKEKYEDPLVFNPWRWKGDGLNTVSKSFMAFGGGMRLCAGAEYAKLQMSIALHILVTKYRWTKISGGEILRRPGLSFPNGLHINIWEKPSTEATI